MAKSDASLSVDVEYCDNPHAKLQPTAANNSWRIPDLPFAAVNVTVSTTIRPSGTLLGLPAESRRDTCDDGERIYRANKTIIRRKSVDAGRDALQLGATPSGIMAAVTSDKGIEATIDGIRTKLVPKRPIQFDAIGLPRCGVEIKMTRFISGR